MYVGGLHMTFCSEKVREDLRKLLKRVNLPRIPPPSTRRPAALSKAKFFLQEAIRRSFDVR
jgi:hypothetical protein